MFNVIFESKSGHRAGQRTLRSFLVFVSYIFGIPLLFINPDAIGDWGDKILSNLTTPNNNLISKYYYVIAFSLAVTGWFVGFQDWSMILLRSFKVTVFSKFNRSFPSRFFMQKVKEDFENSKLENAEEIQSEIYGCIEDSKRFDEVCSDETRWLDQTEVWALNNDSFKNSSTDFILSNVPSTSVEFKIQYKKSIAKIKELYESLEEKKGVDFFVASVQPAFYLVMKQVSRDIGNQNILAVHSRTLTGSGTITYCINEHFKRKSEASCKHISFVAPLSAFVTTENVQAITQKVDPRSIFYPVISVTTEMQHVLYVEGRTSAPKSPRRLYYLNNSTAEECIVSLESLLSERFVPIAIDDYLDYKALLYGQKANDNMNLNAGDGIVLWSPLTNYFNDFGLEGMHLNSKEDNIGFKNLSASRILLFSEVLPEGINPEFNLMLDEIYKAFTLRVSIKKKNLTDFSFFNSVDSLLDRIRLRQMYVEGFRQEFISLFKSNGSKKSIIG